MENSQKFPESTTWPKFCKILRRIRWQTIIMSKYIEIDLNHFWGLPRPFLSHQIHPYRLAANRCSEANCCAMRPPAGNVVLCPRQEALVRTVLISVVERRCICVSVECWQRRDASGRRVWRYDYNTEHRAATARAKRNWLDCQGWIADMYQVCRLPACYNPTTSIAGVSFSEFSIKIIVSFQLRLAWSAAQQ